MAALTPYPFAALVQRMLGELERGGAVFDLPVRKQFRGDAEKDFSVPLHGHRAGTPLGPAAGPHTQMAQNLALAWLGGCRVLELKTVQVRDDLEIPRPCIDMRTVGFNAEWSQELRLDESLREYVKGAMLVEILRARGAGAEVPGFDDTVWDLSVGYDLEGIRSPPVDRFITRMRDAGEVVDDLRRELPPDLRDLPFPRHLSDSVTLSTFHGCPPEEIEKILRHLMQRHRLHGVVKLNPTLLGKEEARWLLHDVLGYRHLTVPDAAFERDTTWERAVEIVERLAAEARSLGLGFGVKLTNTLIVENDGSFLPASEKEVYLSGPPLHVLAMHLVRRFRRQFGPELPISFAAGIDRSNFADAVALGLVPITVCTDLLKPGGYGRLPSYHRELARRMDAVAAASVGDYVLRAYGEAEAALAELGLGEGEPALARCREALAVGGDLVVAAGEELYGRWVARAAFRNTERYVGEVAANPAYGAARNATPPRKIGRHLALFDCVTCDKCIPVCPNGANFAFGEGPAEIPMVRLDRSEDGWRWRETGSLTLGERHQIGNFADFCNDCGNCDVFCPEDGGPYVVKPRFFGSEAGFRERPELDGFYLERGKAKDVVLGRFERREVRLEVAGERYTYSGSGFVIHYAGDDPPATVEGEGPETVDLTYALILDYLRRALLDSAGASWVASLGAAAGEGR